MYFSVRNVFQSERVLNIFKMVISGMKTQFYTSCNRSKYGRITNTNIKFFTVFIKMNIRYFNSIRLTDPFRR